MSCGNPHDLDCAEALARLYEFLDGEVGPDEQHRIAEHFDECAPCLHEFDVERLVKALVARTCCQAAPTELRAKVVAQIVTLRISSQGPFA